MRREHIIIQSAVQFVVLVNSDILARLFYLINVNESDKMAANSLIDPATNKFYPDLVPEGGGVNLQKGYLITANAQNEEKALPVGADGTILMADSNQLLGLRYAVVPGAVALAKADLISADMAGTPTIVTAPAFPAQEGWVLTATAAAVDGTGLQWKNSQQAAFTAEGQMQYGGAAPNFADTPLNLGTAGQVLKVNAGATAPEWVDVGGGGTISAKVPLVESASGSTSQIAINFAAGPAGQIPYGNGTALEGALTNTPAAGQVLGVSAGVPAWINPGGSGTVTALAPLTEYAVGAASNVAIDFTAKGDLVVGAGAQVGGNPIAGVILPVGANDMVLTANSGTASGLEWKAAGSGSAPIINRNSSYTTPLTIAPPASANDTMILTTNQFTSWEWDQTNVGAAPYLGDVIGFTTGANLTPVVPTRQYIGTYATAKYQYTPFPAPPLLAKGTYIAIGNAAPSFYVYWDLGGGDVTKEARIAGFKYWKQYPGSVDGFPNMFVYGSFNRIAPIINGDEIDIANAKVGYCISKIDDQNLTISDFVGSDGLCGVAINSGTVAVHKAYISAMDVNFFEDTVGDIQSFLTFGGYFNCYVTFAGQVLGAQDSVRNLSQLFLPTTLDPLTRYYFKDPSFLSSENMGIVIGDNDGTEITFIYQTQLEGSDFGFFVGGNFTQIGYAAPFLPQSYFVFLGPNLSWFPIAGDAITSPIAGGGDSLTPFHLCIYGGGGISGGPIYTTYIDYSQYQPNIPPPVPAPPISTKFTLPGDLTGVLAKLGGFIVYTTLDDPLSPSPSNVQYDIIGLTIGTGGTQYYRNPGGAASPVWTQNYGINPGSVGETIGSITGAAYGIGTGLINIPASLGTYGLVTNYTVNAGTTNYLELKSPDVNSRARFTLSSGKLKTGGVEANWNPGFSSADMNQFGSQSFVADSLGQNWVQIGAAVPQITYVI